jgi:hypothetical protein
LNLIQKIASSCLLAFALAGAGLSQTANPADGPQEIVSTGIGAIVGGDVAHARDDAIEDALRKGIEQVLGTLLEAQTLVENFQVIDDNIMTKTKGYVQNYQVLKEQKNGPDLYEVTVKAVVKVADIKDDLEGIATLMRRKNMPRAMVMIDEKNIGETPGYTALETDLNSAETTLMEVFMAKGFRFVDQSTVKQVISQQQAAAILEGNVTQAASLGRRLGAEVVLTGKAFAKTVELEAYGAKIRSQQATVTVKAIKTDTGDMLGMVTEQGKFSHIDDVAGGVKAIQQASKKAADNLIPQILNQWQQEVSSGGMITLNVHGVTDYTVLGKFKSGLKYYVRGLASMNQRSWDNGYAVFEVNFKGNSDDLAQRISGKDMEGIRATVTGVTANSVTIKLSGPSAPVQAPPDTTL